MTDYEDFPVPTEMRDKLLADLAAKGGWLILEGLEVEVEVEYEEKQND